MAKIQQKISGQGHSPYENIEDMVQDFVLMFDNACKYNEPDSLIYKVHKQKCFLQPSHFNFDKKFNWWIVLQWNLT